MRDIYEPWILKGLNFFQQTEKILALRCCTLKYLIYIISLINISAYERRFILSNSYILLIYFSARKRLYLVEASGKSSYNKSPKILRA